MSVNRQKHRDTKNIAIAIPIHCADVIHPDDGSNLKTRMGNHKVLKFYILLSTKIAIMLQHCNSSAKEMHAKSEKYANFHALEKEGQLSILKLCRLLQQYFAIIIGSIELLRNAILKTVDRNKKKLA